MASDIDDPVTTRHFPEMGAGGYSSRDGTVEFFVRVRALLGPESVVVDLGAGRGAWLEDDNHFRRDLHDLRDAAGAVIGVDVAPAIAENPSLTGAVLVGERDGLPFASDTIDLVVSDFTFEHVIEPEGLASELERVVKPGGWICARTPNRLGPIAAAATIVPNRRHVAVLKRLQPDRQAVDVFPTAYRMNTRPALRRLFPDDRFRHCSYLWFGDLSYFGRSAALRRLAAVAPRILPRTLAPMLLVFIQKR